jgi:hypothetical protein
VRSESAQAILRLRNRYKRNASPRNAGYAVQKWLQNRRRAFAIYQSIQSMWMEGAPAD